MIGMFPMETMWYLITKLLDETSGTPPPQAPLLHLLVRPHFLSSRPELWPFDPSRKPITCSRQPNCLKFNLRHSFVPQSRDCQDLCRGGPVLLQANRQLWNWNAGFCVEKHWATHDVQSEVSGFKRRLFNLRSLSMQGILCGFPITSSSVMSHSSSLNC